MFNTPPSLPPKATEIFKKLDSLKEDIDRQIYQLSQLSSEGRNQDEVDRNDNMSFSFSSSHSINDSNSSYPSNMNNKNNNFVMDINSAPALNQEIRKLLKIYETSLEDIEIFSKEQDSALLSKSIEYTLSNYEEKLGEMLKFLRQANFKVRRNKEALMQKERTDLLTGSVEEKQAMISRRRRRESALEKSMLTTHAMKQAVDMMTAEIQKSEASLQNIEKQTQMMQQINQEYNVYQANTKQSKSIISRLNRKEAMDRYMIYGGLLFFFLCVFWVVRKRLWLIDPLFWLDVISKSSSEDGDGYAR